MLLPIVGRQLLQGMINSCWTAWIEQCLPPLSDEHFSAAVGIALNLAGSDGAEYLRDNENGRCWPRYLGRT